MLCTTSLLSYAKEARAEGLRLRHPRFVFCGAQMAAAAVEFELQDDDAGNAQPALMSVTSQDGFSGVSSQIRSPGFKQAFSLTVSHCKHLYHISIKINFWLAQQFGIHTADDCNTSKRASMQKPFNKSVEAARKPKLTPEVKSKLDSGQRSSSNSRMTNDGSHFLASE